jgi:hypothetical protein
MRKTKLTPFPTVEKLAVSCGCRWRGYRIAAEETAKAEKAIRKALESIAASRALDADSSLVLNGSFARHEMLKGSDYDWFLLIDGVVNTQHIQQTRGIAKAIKAAGLPSPGASGVFGNMVFSHDLIHYIGGRADSNANLTRRMLLLLESRWLDLAGKDTSLVWENVVGNILKRYFEEDVHFRAKGGQRVPRFLLNDLTRYWRTICVDYAAKYREEDGKKWALRNAKIRFSRKLLYAAGLAFCLSCELNPPKKVHQDLFGVYSDQSVEPFIESALKFARTPPLEYLAAFVESFVEDQGKRQRIALNIFGAYNEWLLLLNDKAAREELAGLRHDEAGASRYFKRVRKHSAEFASGLRELFFNREKDSDPIANLSLDYVGF